MSARFPISRIRSLQRTSNIYGCSYDNKFLIFIEFRWILSFRYFIICLRILLCRKDGGFSTSLAINVQDSLYNSLSAMVLLFTAQRSVYDSADSRQIIDAFSGRSVGVVHTTQGIQEKYLKKFKSDEN